MAGGLVGAASAVSTVGAAVDAFRPPLAGAATRTEVMTAAGWRCERARRLRPAASQVRRPVHERAQTRTTADGGADRSADPNRRGGDRAADGVVRRVLRPGPARGAEDRRHPATTDQLNLFGGDAA